MQKILFIILYFTIFNSFAQLDSLCIEDIFLIENNSFMYKTFKIEVKTYVDQSINVFEWKVYSENQKIYNPYSFTVDSHLKSFVAVPEKLNSIDFLEIIHRSTKFKIKKRDTAFEWLMKYSFTKKEIKHNLTIRHIEPNYTSYEIWNDMQPYAEIIKIDTDTISKFVDNQLECSNNNTNCKINKSKEMIVLFNPLADTYLLANTQQSENKIIIDKKEICQNAHSIYIKNENNQYAWIYISDNCINGGSATYTQPSINTMELKLDRYLFIYPAYGNNCILYDIKSSILVEINGKLEINQNELVISYKNVKNNTFLVEKINLEKIFYQK